MTDELTDQTTDARTDEPGRAGETDPDERDHDVLALEELEARLAEVEQELESLDRPDMEAG